MSSLEFDDSKGKGGKYKVKAISDSTVYANELEKSWLSGLYYLVL